MVAIAVFQTHEGLRSLDHPGYLSESTIHASAVELLLVDQYKADSIMEAPFLWLSVLRMGLEVLEWIRRLPELDNQRGPGRF